MFRRASVDVGRLLEADERADDPLPAAPRAARATPQTARTLAHAARRRRQSALLPHRRSGARTRVRAGACPGGSVAAGGTRAPRAGVAVDELAVRAASSTATTGWWRSRSARAAWEQPAPRRAEVVVDTDRQASIAAHCSSPTEARQERFTSAQTPRRGGRTRTATPALYTVRRCCSTGAELRRRSCGLSYVGVAGRRRGRRRRPARERRARCSRAAQCWTPPDLVGLAAGARRARAALVRGPRRRHEPPARAGHRLSTRTTTSTTSATSSASSCGRTSCSPTWNTPSTIPRSSAW